MASYKNRGGRTMKNERLYIANAFPQEGTGRNGVQMTGYNVQVGVANDLCKDLKQVITDPMLRYDNYTKPDGTKGKSMTIAVSKDQYEAIQAACNKDGDKPVFQADLFPKGSGLMVDTKTLKTPEAPFSKDAHDKNLTDARAMRAAERAAQKDAPAMEAEKQAEAKAAEAAGPEMG